MDCYFHMGYWAHRASGAHIKPEDANDADGQSATCIQCDRPTAINISPYLNRIEEQGDDNSCTLRILTFEKSGRQMKNIHCSRCCWCRTRFCVRVRPSECVLLLMKLQRHVVVENVIKSYTFCISLNKRLISPLPASPPPRLSIPSGTRGRKQRSCQLPAHGCSICRWKSPKIAFQFGDIEIR